MQVTLTHKGWFGVCPVYFSNVHTDAEPLVEPRHWAFDPLMDLSEALYFACFQLRLMVDPDFRPEWPLRITGELDPPRVVEV